MLQPKLIYTYSVLLLSEIAICVCMHRKIRPLIIAHRGSSGQLPEHTIAAYKLAIQQGADYIECDVCLTKDRQLVCLHEPALSLTTDVASRQEFSSRRRNRTITGIEERDWFTVDFTLAELKTLRKKQPRSFRDQSYNGKYQIATLKEFIEVAKDSSREVGIYPEAKHPEFFNGFDFMKGVKMEDLIVDVLNKYGYKDSNANCFIQSFDEDSLKYFANVTNVRLIQLLDTEKDDKALHDLAQYCYGIGPDKTLIIPTEKSGGKFRTIPATDLIKRAHKAGMKVHPYTFRNEDQFLAWGYGQDMNKEFEAFVKLDVDGFFTDFPETLSRFLNTTNEYCHSVKKCGSMVNAVNTNVASDLKILYILLNSMLIVLMN